VPEPGWWAAQTGAKPEQQGYIALYTLILNLVIVILVTPLMNTLGPKPQDQTAAADYYA
jgi:hypothetical protein